MSSLLLCGLWPLLLQAAFPLSRPGIGARALPPGLLLLVAGGVAGSANLLIWLPRVFRCRFVRLWNPGCGAANPFPDFCRLFLDPKKSGFLLASLRNLQKSGPLGEGYGLCNPLGLEFVLINNDSLLIRWLPCEDSSVAGRPSVLLPLLFSQPPRKAASSFGKAPCFPRVYAPEIQKGDCKGNAFMLICNTKA